MTSVSYSVDVNEADIAEALALFRFMGGNADRALQVAINRTGPKVRTKASAAIRTQINQKKRDVDKGLTFKKATRFSLSGKLSTPSRGNLLSNYSTDPNLNRNKVAWLKPPPIPKRGIRIKVKPKGATKQLGSEYFYMVLPKSKALGIVRRKPKGQTGPQGGRFDVAYGPSLSQVFNTVRDDVLPEASNTLQSELLDAMRYLLAKKYPKD